jgi:hypothetical protein
MKRSEMIDLISEILMEQSIRQQVLGFKVKSEEILTKIESAGMLPPDQNKDAETPCEVLTYWEEE